MFAQREDPAPLSGQARLFTVVDALLDEPDSEWWTNEELGVSGRDDMLAYVAGEAYDEIVDLQGDNESTGGTGAPCTGSPSRARRSAPRASPPSRPCSTADRSRSAAAHRS